jgi:hypothetical protein
LWYSCGEKKHKALELRANRQKLDLFTNESIVLERSNPIIEFSVLQGAKVLPFRIPSTPHNLKAIGFHKQNTGTTTVLNGTLNSGGSIIQEGILQIQNVNDTEIKLSLVQQLNKYITEYPQTLSTLMTGVTTKPATPSVTPGGADLFCFPKINNPGYFGSNSYSGMVNKHNGTTYDLTAPLVPCFFVKKMFESISTQTGIVFTGSFFSNTTLDKLILVNLKDVRAFTNMRHADYVPDMNLSQFIKELAIALNLVVFIGSKSIKIDLADPYLIGGGKRIWFEPKNILKESIVDNRLVLTHTPTDAYTKDVNDYTTYLATIAQPNENFELKTTFSTVDVDGGVARIDAKGVSDVNNQLSEKNTFKLAFYDNGTATHTLGTRSLKLVKTGVSLPNSFYPNFERHLANTFEIQIQIPIKPHQAAMLDFHENGGQNMSFFVRDHHYLITKQRIDLKKEIGDFTLQKLTI